MTVYTFDRQGLKLDSAKDVEKYVKEIEEKANEITEISFTGNTLGVEASEALSKAISKLSNLEKADLSDIFTGRLRDEIPTSVHSLLSALLNCKKAHTVDLSDNAFGIATIDPLEKFLAQHTPLVHLILANNGFGPEAGSRVGNALEKLAQAKKDSGVDAKLVTVVCGRNRLENGSMEAWSSFLKAHGTVQELRLYQNGIRPEGIEHLMLNGLVHTPELQKLDLQDNTFTLKGARAISEVIGKWTKLNELQINDTLLSPQGGRIFGEALLNAPIFDKLETINLQYNEIDTKGLELIHDAIKAKIPNLKYLELNGNKFSEDHELIESINGVFEERGFGELDELDDMEDESEDEDQSEEEEEEKTQRVVKDADEVEEQNVAPETSKEVDALAEKVKNL
jgi:Ran GTPase-activating protein 1